MDQEFRVVVMCIDFVFRQNKVLFFHLGNKDDRLPTSQVSVSI